jgi:trans-aconitate methyltransferase
VRDLNAVDVDWAAWAARWERRQAVADPRGDDRSFVMLELVSELTKGKPARILQLGSGVGTLVAATLERFPEAELVAVDSDPLLLAIGQGVQGDGGGRLRWVRADLRRADWAKAVAPSGPYDAVISTRGLRHLDLSTVLAVYRKIGELMWPGGVFLTSDDALLGPQSGALTRASRGAASRLVQMERFVRAQRAPAESAEAWQSAVQDEPAFADLLRQYPEAPSEHDCLPAELHLQALIWARFSDAAVVWRHLDDVVMGAIR